MQGGALEENEEGAYLGALTSAPLSISRFTTCSSPPEQATWMGRTPWRTELIGWPLARAYLTRP